jgi:hypothetical protein
MTATFKIREATPADVADVAHLFCRVEEIVGADEEAVGRWWHAQHFENPSGPSLVLVAHDPDIGIVGHIAAIRTPFVHEERALVGGFLCQLMVADSHRRTLAFPRLETALLRRYHDEGVDFLYGLINRPEVLKAHRALRLRPGPRYPVYARPVRLSRILDHLGRGAQATRLATPFLPAGEWVLRHLRRPPRGVAIAAGLDRITGELAPRLARALVGPAPAPVRNRSILAWRFGAFPDRGYQVVVAGPSPRGYAVLRRMAMHGFDVLAIVDLVSAPGDRNTIDALLHEAIERAEAGGCDLVACMCAPDGGLAARLRSRLFRATPEAFTLIVHQPRGAPDLLASAPWPLTWFDHDFV